MEDGNFTAKLVDGQQLDIAIDGGFGTLRASTWHQTFGESFPNQCIEIVFAKDKLETVFTWQQFFRNSSTANEPPALDRVTENVKKSE